MRNIRFKHFIIYGSILSSFFFAYFSVYLPFTQMNNMPEPYKFELPKFKCKIFPGYAIIIRKIPETDEFATISTWEENAVLVYSFGFGALAGNNIRLEAFSIDDKENTRYAAKLITAPSDWKFFHSVGKTVKNGSQVTVFPCKDLAMFALVFGAILTLLCWVLVFCNWDKKVENLYISQKPVEGT